MDMLCPGNESTPMPYISRLILKNVFHPNYTIRRDFRICLSIKLLSYSVTICSLISLSIKVIPFNIYFYLSIYLGATCNIGELPGQGLISPRSSHHSHSCDRDRLLRKPATRELPESFLGINQPCLIHQTWVRSGLLPWRSH